MRCVYLILELCLDCKLISLCFGLVTVFWSNHAELDFLEADMGMETESDSVPSYLQPDKETDYDAELNLPSAPTGQTAMHAGRAHGQVNFIFLFSYKIINLCRFHYVFERMHIILLSMLNTTINILSCELILSSTRVLDIP